MNSPYMLTITQILILTISSTYMGFLKGGERRFRESVCLTPLGSSVRNRFGMQI